MQKDCISKRFMKLSLSPLKARLIVYRRSMSITNWVLACLDKVESRTDINIYHLLIIIIIISHGGNAINCWSKSRSLIYYCFLSQIKLLCIPRFFTLISSLLLCTWLTLLGLLYRYGHILFTNFIRILT